MHKLHEIKLKELLKFLVGGGSAVLVDFIVYMVLKQWMDYNVAKTISFISGSVVGFIINKLWTFESKKFNFKEVYKYIILYTISAFVNAAINHAVLYITKNTFLAFLFATGTSTVINFIGQKFFVFSKIEKEK